MGFGYGIFFTEPDRNRVIRWDPDLGTAEVVAGFRSSDGTQSLQKPYGLAFDKDGLLLIADKLHDRVVRLKNGIVEKVFWQDVDGHRKRLEGSRQGYHPTIFYSPSGLFVEPEGTILVTFFNEGTLYRVHLDGRLEHVLGILPNRCYHIGNPTGEPVRPDEIKDTPIHCPVGVVSRSDGTIFLIERGCQLIREYHPQRGLRTTFPPAKRIEWRDRMAAPLEAKCSDYAPSYPTALALDSQERLHISDMAHGCILKLDQTVGSVQRVMQSRRIPGSRRGGISALAFGPDGTAWVMDSGAGVVEAYQVPRSGPWLALGITLSLVEGEPLQLPPGGAGMATRQ